MSYKRWLRNFSYYFYRGFAAMLGGTLAATSHVAKATKRAAVNTSPESLFNIGMSLLVKPPR